MGKSMLFLLFRKDAISILYSPSQVSSQLLDVMGKSMLFLLFRKDAISILYSPSQVSSQLLDVMGKSMLFLLFRKDAISILYSPSQQSSLLFGTICPKVTKKCASNSQTVRILVAILIFCSKNPVLVIQKIRLSSRNCNQQLSI